ncbi:hypothetical protein MT356_16105 [Rathayibacter festucae]|uniref:hypothetical protein n=1 Tax=Rathayibacter festucae TaxID=110937 RepID=UPI001FB1DE81|nr:hypothetical protein [Rathayibacter festucae]MCJ1701235.1 hypothetical protein [Rathayibacter festucae]
MRLSELETAQKELGYSVDLLASRAGLSRATGYRILSGQTDPRLDDLRELLLAAGLDLDLSVRPLSDPHAASAARAMLGDLSVAPGDEEIAAWTARLTRYSRGETALLLGEAGRASAPQHRPGAVALAGPRWSIDRLASAGHASGDSWALSGAAAFDAMGYDLRGVSVLWTTDPRRVTQLLADTLTPTTTEHADVLVVPAPAALFQGAVDVDGVVLVSPLQAVLDGIGLGGDLAAIASELGREWS